MNSHTHSGIRSGTLELRSSKGSEHAHLQRQAVEAEAKLHRSSRRWLRAVLAVDLAGLPLLVLLAPWHWAVALAVWVVLVAAFTAVALAVQVRADSRHDEWWQRQVEPQQIATPQMLRPSGRVMGFTPPAARAG